MDRKGAVIADIEICISRSRNHLIDIRSEMWLVAGL